MNFNIAQYMFYRKPVRKADKKRMKKQQKALERKLEAEGNKIAEITKEIQNSQKDDEISPQLESLSI